MNIKRISTNIALFIIGAVLAMLAFTAYDQIEKANASVQIGNGYQARQLTSANIGTTTISSQYAIVGSLVVSSTSPVTTIGPVMAFYDTASTTISTTTMTAKYSFGSRGGVTPPAGTYTFDVEFGNGIYLWVDPNFNGSYTITYR